MPQRRFHRKHWLLIDKPFKNHTNVVQTGSLHYAANVQILFIFAIAFLLCLALLLPDRTVSRVHAELSAAPNVSYNSAVNTIYIGSDSGAPPASQPLTVPQLAAALTSQNLNNLVLDRGGGAWLIKANVVISTTARLEATNATIKELRLDSPPVNPLSITAKLRGHLLVSDIKVSAWENNALDTNVANGRSYLLALNGGQMDILASEIFNLGYTNGEPSGISWRERVNDADPTTGSTGSLLDSDVHDNYFGVYSYAAYNVKLLRNKVHDNLGYGIDPHSSTQNFEVANNEVSNNQLHGIIFSRDCINNWIHDNTVHDNGEHGIMLDRGSNSNVLENNTVYHNQDGFAIFESSHNIVRSNVSRDNAQTGIRINASFTANDPFDDVATDNQILSNTFTNNPQGVYLYARADRNLIANNTITGSTVNGIYIKTGGNIVRANVIQGGVVGIAIVDGTDPANPLPAQAKPPLDPPGHNNLVIGSTISGNTDAGIRVMGGVDNRIGTLTPTAQEKGNLIEDNQTDGVVIGKYATNNAISTGNQVLGNTLRNNGRHGISLKDASSVRNRFSQNSITGNKGYGIRLDLGAQDNIVPPVISAIQPDGHINGAARPNATVELYSDPTGEGKDFLGKTTADNAGNWATVLPGGTVTKLVTALQTDAQGNSSAFTGGTGGALYAVGVDINGQTTITVTGNGAAVTLADIKTGLGISNTKTALLHCGNTALLQDLGSGKWRLNANLFIGPNVTLNIGPQSGAAEVQLCSQPTVAASRAHPIKVIQSDEAADVASATLAIDYLSFVYLRTHSGVINLDNAKVYSWDPTANAFDQDSNNGRAYVIAKYAATLNIHNSELSYLGSADGESYGVSWRDTNDTLTPDVLRTRVTGEVINSNFHHNYYGVYTFQATTMSFIGNQFHDNIRYGFDPHDFTHDVLVENNAAYDNGAHGFIISRGCNNFTFRNNRAYNNLNPDPIDQAQGFMLDPGSPDATSAQAPSTNNLLEGNVAYDNEGFGLRILGSTANQVLNNRFYQNQKGVVIDEKSTGNLIDSNVITQNLGYGLVTQETADANTITRNNVRGNGDHGIYLHSNTNLISGNTTTANVGAGIAFYTPGLALTANQVLSNTASGNGGAGIDLRNAVKTLVQGNLVENNNGLAGIYLSGGASQNALRRNTIHANQGVGIRANGPTTVNNSWSENALYGNLLGGIVLSSGGNLNLAAPQLLNVLNNSVAGNAPPGATVELFSDNARQGQFFEQRTTADTAGRFSFTLAPNGQGANLTAIALDSQSNASPFSSPISRQGQPAPTGTPTGANKLYLPTVRR
ncbi:MAG: right-handed parallel beta-helix repeat-containing protein [Caldilineaceae bacterium]